MSFNLTTQDGPDDRDPREIDWTESLARAVVPFELDEKGVPVNPKQSELPDLPEGRNELWHWGEAVAADAIVFAVDDDGKRSLLMVERDDDHGWALPGGCLDPNEMPQQAVARELEEETRLIMRESDFEMQEGRYVPDPRAGRNAWMVTVPGLAVLHTNTPPEVIGSDDARRAMWLPANDYAELEAALAKLGGRVFAAHVGMLQEILR